MEGRIAMPLSLATYRHQIMMLVRSQWVIWFTIGVVLLGGCHSSRRSIEDGDTVPQLSCKNLVMVDVWGGVERCGVLRVNELSSCDEIVSLAGGLSKAHMASGTWRVYKGIDYGIFSDVDPGRTMEKRHWVNGNILLVPYDSAVNWPEEHVRPAEACARVFVRNYVIKEGWHYLKKQSLGSEILDMCGGGDSYKFMQLRYYRGLAHYAVDDIGGRRFVEYFAMPDVKTNAILNLSDGDMLYFLEAGGGSIKIPLR